MKMPIGNLLVANRGEIALRIFRTARRLGIRTIAVYSDADADAQHVRFADAAIRLGPANATASYLNVAAVLGAARQSGADAIHPGYGFLSENADFAADCRSAGLIFVGPDDRALRIMGSKSAAKAAVAAAGVRILPGYQGAEQDDAILAREAERVGFPLLVKAVAGGGGKGMRIVREAAVLADALAAARREALAAFGDASVMLERFLDAPRHVEIQVFGDAQGNVVHLFERDCSLQRRHQKVIETQAVAAARAVSYQGAGTVEFLCQDGAAWFIEMNTRLQVEHPVTEAITGLDLVEWQLRIAGGEPLPLQQKEIRHSGHAIEVRLCAEDPRHGLLPAVGKLERFYLCGDAPQWRRFDSGFVAGDTVTPHYDSLLAKLIVHAPDRDAAIERMRASLRDLRVAGVATNRSFLDVLLQAPEWRSGRFDTNWIARESERLLALSAAQDATPPPEVSALLAIALLKTNANSAVQSSPWQAHDGFAPNLPRTVRLWLAPDSDTVDIEAVADGYRVTLGQRQAIEVRQVVWRDGHLSGQIAGRRWNGEILADGDRCRWLSAEGTFSLQRYAPELGGGALGAGANNRIVAPMPGQVLAVHVTAGELVERGAKLLTLEAMKMEHSLTAGGKAVVAEVLCSAGQRVLDGALLLRLDPV
jgi:3-methylcrotonyl-CoA carboxylase alpha subunit